MQVIVRNALIANNTDEIRKAAVAIVGVHNCFVDISWRPERYIFNVEVRCLPCVRVCVRALVCCVRPRDKRFNAACLSRFAFMNCARTSHTWFFCPCARAQTNGSLRPEEVVSSALARLQSKFDGLRGATEGLDDPHIISS